MCRNYERSLCEPKSDLWRITRSRHLHIQHRPSFYLQMNPKFQTNLKFSVGTCGTRKTYAFGDKLLEKCVKGNIRILKSLLDHKVVVCLKSLFITKMSLTSKYSFTKHSSLFNTGIVRRMLLGNLFDLKAFAWKPLWLQSLSPRRGVLVLLCAQVSIKLIGRRSRTNQF